jgi:uncharacterized spore protein YtfJ
MMDRVESLVKTTLDEVEKALSAKTVIGEPITIGEATLIPVISVGFAFGAGGGQAKSESKRSGESVGSGVGGGAWAKPRAVIVVDKAGVRIEPITGRISFALEKLGETVPKMMEAVLQKIEDRKKEG